ncbi:hypothetical protein [Paracoccus spongiarum]|uniref:DUF2975 domain-containing protein n=1 Tax=Paracoccus spongiarum TaxID=3064387 RepID=A0ABT9JDJ2_9RHOB|nr:hypothetical protein [Paracoccus sp. 2205BS29-5]MDP5307141.1 hypothetical protein [Paracoccus sp. 2205BS29-5]
MQLIARRLLDLAVVALALLCLVLAGDAVFRGGAGAGILGDRAIVPALIVAVLVLPLAAATAARAHLAVTFLSDRMATSDRARLVLLGHAVGLVALLVLIAAAIGGLAGVLAGGRAGLPGDAALTLLAVGLLAMALRLAGMLAQDRRTLRDTGTITDEHGQEAI